MAGPTRFNNRDIKLYRWRWSGKNSRGQRVKGQLVAGSRAEVEKLLGGQRILPSSIRRRSQVGRGLGSIKSRDITLFARQMATMIRAGLPVLQAFQVVAEGISKPAMSALVQRLLNDVAAGSTFAEALAKHPRQFDSLFISLVAAGEQSGTLDRMLERVAFYKEKTDSIVGRVKKALWYPSAVILIGMSVTALLLIKVVPQFESMFAGFGAELPALTQFTIRLSELAQAHWWHAVLGLVGTVLGIRFGARRSSAFAYLMHSLLLRIPVIGNIVLKAILARYARTLSITFAAGVPLIEALETSAGSAGNRVYERALQQVRTSVAEGQQLQFAMRMTDRFPALMVQMVGRSEERRVGKECRSRGAADH